MLEKDWRAAEKREEWRCSVWKPALSHRRRLGLESRRNFSLFSTSWLVFFLEKVVWERRVFYASHMFWRWSEVILYGYHFTPCEMRLISSGCDDKSMRSTLPMMMMLLVTNWRKEWRRRCWWDIVVRWLQSERRYVDEDQWMIGMNIVKT